MKTINKGNSVFTNVALTEDGDIWWEGLENPPAHATSWKGEPWTPDTEELSSHPNSRYCTPIKQCDILAAEYDDPRGVPIDAILFGGRRKTTVPLVFEARDWTHGTFLGATLSWRPPPPRSARSASCAATRWRCCRSSATTPATTSTTGSRSARRTTPRSCPGSSTSTGSAATTRAASCGPASARTAGSSSGSSSASTGQAAAVETPIGHVPTKDALDVEGLDMTDEALEAALARRRRGVEGRDPADHRSGSRSSATSSRRCCGPSSTASRPASASEVDELPDPRPLNGSRLWDHRRWPSSGAGRGVVSDAGLRSR